MLKKILAPMFMPLSLVLVLLVLGLIFIWFTRRQRAGKIIVTLGALLLVVLSYDPLPDAVMRPLEYEYPPMKRVVDPGVKWVVVLGGGHTSDPALPVTSRLGSATLMRLMEGIRLYRSIPAGKLLVSGGSVFDPVPNAGIMARVAEAVGVDRSDIVLESESKDTEEEAILIKKMVGQDKFILVTSASHMPRSMALFRKQGMHPVPAPTDYRVKRAQGPDPGMFFPAADNLRKNEISWHEYLGLAWARLLGVI